jgi:hypothetical protein
MDIAEYHPFQKSLPAVYGMAQTYIDHQLNESSIRNAVNELLDEKVGLAIREFMYGLLAEIPGNTALRKVMGDLLHLPADEARVQELINSVLEDKSNEAHISHLVDKLLTGTTYPVPEKEQVRLLLEKHQPNQFGVSRKTRILQEIVPQTLGLTLFDLLDQEDQALKKKQLRKVREAYKKYQLAHLAVKEKLTLQLRGFLMVFEQILADYLAQLASIRQLFSFDPQVQQTYVAQSLEGVDDLESLFLDYDQYRESQKELTETEETFIKRRNAFLDHLLGRFGEDMSKYAFYLNAALGKKAGSKLIADKIDFLADYIEVSKNRGKGFDYSNGQETWDSDNVEGLKKRICRLLGIKEYRERDNDFNRNAGGDDPEEHYQARDYNKKFIAPAAIHVDKVKRDDNIEWYGVTLTDPEDPDYVLLKSELYEFEDEAQEILNYILAHGVAENLYEKEGRRDNWSYHLKRAAQENNEEPVASGYFQSQQESEDAFRRTIEVLTEYAQDENFHLLEHLLLRPRIPARSPTNRQGVLNADAVDFLSVAYVSDKALAGQRQENAGEEAQVTFRFYIKSEKDPHQKSKTIWHLSLVDAESKEVLLVDEVFSLYRHLTRRIEQIRQFGSDRSNYEIGLVSDDNKNFSIQDAARPLAVSKNTFRLEEDLEAGIASLITFFSYERDVFQDEGENYDDVSFLADPYSFQISILIPDWPAKFRNLTFKHLLEKTIYLETPAHIYAHVYWLDHKQMRDFEEAYKLWLEEMATGQIPNAQLVNNLIAQLNALRQ